MKKRIIASTMASVMALGAASSMMVASADIADFKTQTATKADLEKLMADKEIKNLIDGGIDNYGSVSGETFQKATDFATAVLEDIDATTEDYTAAYLMVKAAKNALKVYSKEELKLLISQCTSIYNTNNELNEDDAKYTDDSWEKFVEAYETAVDCQDSDDGLEVTDAYEELDKYKNPTTLDTVTKKEIEAARKNYIAALDKEFDYQPWQRGTVKDSGVSDYDGRQFAWGVLFSHIESGREDLMRAYEDFTEIKGRNVTSNTTTVAAVKAMNDAAKVLNAFDSKLDSASSKKPITDLLAKYHGQLVYTYNYDVSEAVALSFATVAESINIKTGVNGTAKFVNSEGKLADVASNALAKKSIWHAVESSKKDYKPLGDNGISDTASTGQKYSYSGTKTISAEMKMQADVELFYIVETSKKLENNKNPIVGASGTYFYGTKSAADGAISSVDGYATSKTYEVKNLSPKTSFVFSDIIGVGATEISANYVNDIVANEADASLNTVKENVIAAITTTSTGLYAEAVALSGALDTLRASITTIGYDTVGGTSTEKPDENTYNTTLKTVDAWIDTVDDILAAIPTKIDTGATVVDATKLNKSKFDTLESLVAGLDTDAIKALEMNVADGSGTVAVTAVTQALETSKTGYNTQKTAYNAAYASLQEDNAAYGNYAKNDVFDFVEEADFALKSSKTDKGLKFFYNGASLSSFDTTTPYGSPRENGSSITTVSLDTAMAMYEAFVATKTDQRSAAALDNMNDLPAELEEGKNYSKAWKLLYNYMKYALADEFDASATSTYKRSDIVSLKSKAEDLIDQCVETELFSDSVNNTKTNVNAASEWLTMAKADKSRYKDNDSKYDVTTVGVDAKTDTTDKDSTAMYNELNDTYKQLKKEYDAFKYGFGEIVTKISDIAKDLDSNKFGADTTKKLADELNDVALKFVKVEAVKKDGGDEFDDSSLFNDDGTMNKNNRLFTNGSTFKSLYYDNGKVDIAESKKNETGKNYSHYELQTAYEKLVKDYDAAVKALEEGGKLVYDLTGDGKIDVADVNALIAVYFNPTADDIAKYDYNGDKKIDVADVQALIAEYFKS